MTFVAIGTLRVNLTFFLIQNAPMKRMDLDALTNVNAIMMLLVTTCLVFVSAHRAGGVASVHLPIFLSYTECTNETYGPGCINKCKCYNAATCDHVSGVCLCTPGWRGRQCTSTYLSFLYRMHQ